MKWIIITFILFVFAGLNAATVSGVVKSAESGEKLSNITIRLKGANLVTMTNKEGYFVFADVPAGEQELFIGVVGYKPYLQKFALTAKSQQKVEAELIPMAIKLADVTVTAKKFDDIAPREIKVGTIRQTSKEIKEVVAVGDADIFRALAFQPGVVPIADFSAGLYVRGGTPDQNLILLDGIDVYNPSHFGGIFSTFNTDAVSSVELIKGGYPAKYGGRLSSVMDVQNMDGNRRAFHGMAKLSAISTSATLQGPWEAGSQSGSYMGSFRRTYLDVLRGIQDNIPDYYFYDGHAKFNWDLNSTDKLQTSCYFGRDNLDMDVGADMKIYWGNTTFSQQWVHVFNPKLFSHFTAAGSRYYSVFEYTSDSDQGLKRLNDIYDGTIKAEFSYKPVDAHFVDFGLETKFNTVCFKVEEKNSSIDPDGLPNVSARSNTTTAYIQDSWEINPRWTFQPGLRLGTFKSYDINLENSPQADRFLYSTTASLRYKINEASNTYVSYGHYYQVLTSLNMGISTPFDIWFPLDGSLKPGQSDHYILGYQNQFCPWAVLEAETYYKNMHNLTEYRAETDYEWSNSTMNLGDALNTGHGWSAGIDLLLREQWQAWEGFIGYSWSRTRRTINDTNLDPKTGKPVEYYARYDRTHQINLVQNYNLTEGLDWRLWGGEEVVGFNLTYGSGQPIAKPEEVFFDGDNLQAIYSYNDGYRLPPYFRLDVSYKVKYYKKGWTIEPYAQITNLTNNKNIWSRDYSYSLDTDLASPNFGRILTKNEDTYQFPLLPFIGVNVEW